MRVICILLGIATGLYVGGWIMFVGGIVQLIEAVKAVPVDSVGIAMGILRIIAASAVGTVIACIGFIIGSMFD